MHHAKYVLKSHMFGGWKHPPCRLQLMNLPHPLNPRMINQILFGRFACRQSDS
jgi:hypothetical protein